MREIKFRGKRVDNNKWVYGSLIIHISEAGKGLTHAFIEEIPSHWNTTSLDKNAHFWEHRRYKVDPKTVGQFTGLHDENCKEIWEGDIVEWEDCVPKDKRDVVEIQPPRLWLKNEAFGFEGEELISPNLCKIIGNIHDNPELLK